MILVAAGETSGPGAERVEAQACPSITRAGAAVEWSALLNYQEDGSDRRSEVLLVKGAQLVSVALDGSDSARVVEASTGSGMEVGGSSYGVGRFTWTDASPSRGTQIALASCRPFLSESGGKGAEEMILLKSAAGQVRPAKGSELYEIVSWTHANQAGRRLAVGRAPAWSPDGRHLAFLSKYDYATGSIEELHPTLRLYVMPASGGVPRELARTVVSVPQWSSDGQRLAFLSGEGESRPVDSSGDVLRVVDVDGAGQRLLATDAVSAPSWSPDGRRLAFARAEEDDVRLFTISADGSNPRRVTSVEGWQRGGGTSDPTRAWIPTVAWSPDGMHLLYTCGRRLCVVSLDGTLIGTSPKFSAGASLGVWSPDGTRIAVARADLNPLPAQPEIALFTMARDGSDLQILLLATSDSSGSLIGIGVPGQAAPDDLAQCTTGVAVPDLANHPGLVEDCETLLRVRDVLSGSGELSWSADKPIGDWQGVMVGGAPVRVRGLNLAKSGLRGRIPPELAQLAGLETLNLSFNQLGGVLPAELSGLAELRELDISHTYVGGGIPPEIGRLARLQKLNLTWTYLSGAIPPELGGLTQLKHLALKGRGLGAGLYMGTIPSELGQLANLELMDLSGHQLTGDIPSELGQLAKLKELDLSDNQLSGHVPLELVELMDLQALYLRSNRLTGCLLSALQDVPNNDLTTLLLPNCGAE